VDELNAIHARAMASRDETLAIGRAGRARVMADHTYARRLDAMTAVLGA